MKKLLNSLAAIAMAASLTACSSSKSSAYSGTTKGTAKGMGDITQKYMCEKLKISRRTLYTRIKQYEETKKD